MQVKTLLRESKELHQYATPDTLQSKFLVQLNSCWQSTFTLAARRPMLFGMTDIKFFVGLRSTKPR